MSTQMRKLLRLHEDYIYPLLAFKLKEIWRDKWP